MSISSLTLSICKKNGEGFFSWCMYNKVGSGCHSFLVFLVNFGSIISLSVVIYAGYYSCSPFCFFAIIITELMTFCINFCAHFWLFPWAKFQEEELQGQRGWTFLRHLSHITKSQMILQIYACIDSMQYGWETATLNTQEKVTMLVIFN